MVNQVKQENVLVKSCLVVKNGNDPKLIIGNKGNLISSRKQVIFECHTILLQKLCNYAVVLGICLEYVAVLIENLHDFMILIHPDFKVLALSDHTITIFIYRILIFFLL